MQSNKCQKKIKIKKKKVHNHCFFNFLDEALFPKHNRKNKNRTTVNKTIPTTAARVDKKSITSSKYFSWNSIFLEVNCRCLAPLWRKTCSTQYTDKSTLGTSSSFTNRDALKAFSLKLINREGMLMYRLLTHHLWYGTVKY